MKKKIILLLLLFSVIGVNSQTKKKSSVQKKKQTSTISVSKSNSEKLVNSIFLLCDSDNKPIAEIVGMEQKTEYRFYAFYGAGKLVIFQGGNADEAIAKGVEGNGTWEISSDNIIISLWGNTTKYKLKSDGNLSEDKYFGNTLRFLDKF